MALRNGSSTLARAAHGASEAGAGSARAPARAAPLDARLRHGKVALEFSKIVTVLMRDASCRNLRLADLEGLVLPPLMLGQYQVAHAKRKTGGSFVPVAAALWARTSADVDRELSGDRPPRLHPSQWASGSNVWLMVTAGDKRALTKLITRLRASEFKGHVVKLRVPTADGKISIRDLGRVPPSIK